MDDPEIIVSLHADIEREFIHFTQEDSVSTVVHVYIGLVSDCPISDCGISPNTMVLFPIPDCGIVPYSRLWYYFLFQTVVLFLIMAVLIPHLNSCFILC